MFAQGNICRVTLGEYRRQPRHLRNNMKKFLAFLMIFLASFALVSAQESTGITMPVPQTINTAACNQQADRLLISEWNSGNILALCQDFSGKTVVKTTVPATAAQQLIPLYDENTFLSYSGSGKLRWHTPQTSQQWLIPAGGSLTNDSRFGLTLANAWEQEKWYVSLFYNGWYDAIRVDSGGLICTAEAATGDLHVCVQGNNKVVMTSRQLDFAGRREYRQLTFEQFPVGAVEIGGKIYVLLAMEYIYPPCNDPVCSVPPSRIIPGSLVEIRFDYGQTEATQRVVLDGLRVEPIINEQKVAATKDAIYFASGRSQVVKFVPGTGKASVVYDAGPNTHIGALAAISGSN